MQIQRLVFFPITFGLTFLSSKAFALPTCTVFSSQAQGLNGPLISLKVWPGHDLTILLPPNELVKDAIIGDPTQLVYGSLAGKLCPPVTGNPVSGNHDVVCNSSGTRYMYVRRINKLQGFQLVSSADGSTDLKWITEGPSGTKPYQVGLIPMSTGTPSECTTLRIVSDPEHLPPILPSKPSRESFPAPAESQPPLTDNKSQLQSQVPPTDLEPGSEAGKTSNQADGTQPPSPVSNLPSPLSEQTTVTNLPPAQKPPLIQVAESPPQAIADPNIVRSIPSSTVNSANSLSNPSDIPLRFQAAAPSLQEPTTPNNTKTATSSDLTPSAKDGDNPVKGGSGALSGREGEGFNNTDNRSVQTDNSNKPSPSLLEQNSSPSHYDYSTAPTDQPKHGEGALSWRESAAVNIDHSRTKQITENTAADSRREQFPAPSFTRFRSTPLIPSEDATALAFGLLDAIQKGEINPQSPLWTQAQTALSLLRRGASRTDALHAAGLEPLVFNSLLELGKNSQLAITKKFDISE